MNETEAQTERALGVVLGRVEGKLDALIANRKEDREAQAKVNEDLNKRVTAVERKVWAWGGGITVLTILLNVGVRYLWH